MPSIDSKFQSPCLDQGESIFFTRLPGEIRDYIYHLYASVDAISDGVSTSQPEQLFLNDEKPYDGDSESLALRCCCQRVFYEMRRAMVREVALAFYSQWNFRLQLAVHGRLDWARTQKLRIQLRNEDKFNLIGAGFTNKALLRTKALQVLYIDCSEFNRPSNRAIGPNIVISSPDPEVEANDEAEFEEFEQRHFMEAMLADCGTQLETLETVVLDGKGRYPAFWPEQVRQYVKDEVQVIELQ
ncbi:hypothetical protein TGAM01_v200224 [Trichoderma gamsii]|uniref:Uncharacterized protein n=1 Tax=Trichoderma gamsii TaxID=398673 RepID=A0A2P5A2Q5_9HYPO|nr:hypothetical protein TGAM01_v200224 [Trichoderma gamsii]PON30804.1 hypothetical protein TGAM01_v200224 [Trichoderma gamsii]